MRLFKKIALVSGILVLLILVSTGGTALYFYYHPSRVKTFIEKTVSRVAGISCVIQDLSWSIDPLSLRAEGIVLRPLQDRQDFHIDIPSLQADMTLEGHFGEKSLVVKRIDLEGLSVRIIQEIDLPQLPVRKEGDTLLGRMSRAALSILFFRDLRLDDISLSGAEVVALLGDTKIRGYNISAQVGENRFLTITLNVDAVSSSKGIEIKAPDLRITTDQSLTLVKPEIRGRLSVLKSAFKTPAGGIKRADIHGEFLYRLKDHVVTLQPMSLDIEGLEFFYQSEKILFPSALRVEAKGNMDLKNQRIELPFFSLFAKDHLEIRSAIEAGKDSGTGVEISLLDCILWPESLRAIFPKRIKEDFAPLTLAGPVLCRGRISGRREGEIWNLEGVLEGRFKDNPYEYEIHPIRLAGVLTGTVSVKGKFPDIGLLAEASSDETILSGTGINLPPSLISVSLSGKYPLYAITRARIHCPSMNLTFRKREIPVENISLNITDGILDARKRSLAFPHILLDSSFLGNVNLTLNSADGGVDFSAYASETDLIKRLFDIGIIPPGWQITGKDAWNIHIQNMGKESWEFTLETGLSDAAFQDPEGRFMGEKIKIVERLNGEFRPGDRHIFANTALNIRAGEILLDRFYIDVNRHNFSATGMSRYGLSDRNLELTGLTLNLQDILKMTIDGNIMPVDAGLQTGLHAVIPEINVTPLFEHFMLEPFKGELPVLEQLELDGDLSADLNLKGSGREWAVLGTLTWLNGKLILTDPDIALQGIRCNLPLWYQTHPAEGTKALKGMLSIEEMRLPILRPQSLDVPLEAGPNSLASLSPVVLEIPGGYIRLERIFFKELFSTERFTETGLEIRITDTRPLLNGMLPREIQGTIEGKLGDVHLKKNSLSSTGHLKAGLFGGEIILSDIGASGLFTPAPAIRLSAQWKDLRLAELTADTEFGKIEGILQGSVKGLEVAFGQPQRFELWMETLKKEGVPQRISVRAVENIARIGGGQSPFMGMAGILTSFFKEFPYRKIGIHTSLENDVFRIHGTIKEGGKEYLIKRDGFSGVDVVNQNPDNRIRFKDMVKRIKRVTSSKGGPVIK